MRKPNREPRWTRMRTAALARATADLDAEFAADSFNPPDAEARARHRSAKRRRGRPRQGLGAKVVSITLERSVLTRASALSRRLGLSRSRLIERGLLGLLAREGA